MPGVGWGVEPILNSSNTVESGTTSVDVRKTWGAMYSGGIVRGINIRPQTTDYRFSVGEGVVMVPTGPSEAVPVYVEAQNVYAPNPNNQSLHMSIVVTQPLVGATNTAFAQVLMGTTSSLPTIPAGSQSVYNYRFNSNSTAASHGSVVGIYPASVPYGANLGVYAWHTDTSNSLIPWADALSASMRVSVPTDRKVLVSAQACLSAMRANGTTPAVGFDNTAYCEVEYNVYIDGDWQWSWVTPGLHEAKMHMHFEEYVNLRKGSYTFQIRTRYNTASTRGRAMRHHRTANQGTGTYYAVRDIGIYDGTEGI